jgi:hypothetical protein
MYDQKQMRGAKFLKTEQAKEVGKNKCGGDSFSLSKSF